MELPKIITKCAYLFVFLKQTYCHSGTDNKAWSTSKTIHSLYMISNWQYTLRSCPFLSHEHCLRYSVGNIYISLSGHANSGRVLQFLQNSRSSKFRVSATRENNTPCRKSGSMSGFETA